MLRAQRRERQLEMRLLLVTTPLFFFALPNLLDDERREHPWFTQWEQPQKETLHGR